MADLPAAAVSGIPRAQPESVQKPKYYRGIVVVHGVGEHKKGSYVSGFVEELAKFLCNVEELKHGKVQLTARNRTDTSDTSWATITIENPDPEAYDEEWHIREAWWTRTFQPSKPGRIYLWAVLAGLALIWSALVQQLARGVLSVFKKTRLQVWPTERLGRPFDRANHTPLSEAEQGAWRQPETGPWRAVADGVVWFVFTLVYALAGLAGILVIGIVYLVLVVPLSFFFPQAANRVIKAMMRIIVFTLGDQEAMTTRQLALAAAANEVNAGLWAMLSADGMRNRRSNDERFEGFDTVTVVAHSGGCVVSMAALKSADFRRFKSEPATYWTEVQEPDGRTRRREFDFHRPKRLNWITAGSGLNLAWNVRFGGDAADTNLWESALDDVNWLNLYARYDPVAQGPAPSSMVEQLLGRDPECDVRPPEPGGVPETAPRPSFVALRIVNTDSPWGDHGAYWDNHPEAMSRVVHVITSNDLAENPISPQDTAIGAKNILGLQVALEAKVDREIVPRRSKVTRSVSLRLAGAAAFLAVAWAWGDDIGRWVMGTDTFLGLPEWSSGGKKLANVVTWKAEIAGRLVSELVIGTAALGLAAILAFQYWGIRRWLWGYAKSKPTARLRVLWAAPAVVILVATPVLLGMLVYLLPKALA